MRMSRLSGNNLQLSSTASSRFEVRPSLDSSSKAAKIDLSVDYNAVGVHEHDYVPLDERRKKWVAEEEHYISAWDLDVESGLRELKLVVGKSPDTDIEAKLSPVDANNSLGKGNFGKVFRANFEFEEGEKKLCAVKRINIRWNTSNEHEEFELDQARSEVTLMMRLQHPHIIGYIGSYRSKTTFNVVMEYADGGTLAEKIRPQTRSAPYQTIARWLGESLSALDYMHSLSVLHRDIKPENILLKKRMAEGRQNASAIEGDEEYEIKLADLGLATVKSSIGKRTIVGTDIYSSYEKLHGERYNSEDDIWGLGCVFAELLTGRRLHGKGEGNWGVLMSSKLSRMQLKKQEVLQACVDADEKIGQLVGKMLREVPAERPNAKSLLESLVLVSLKRELLRSNCVYSIHERNSVEKSRTTVETVLDREQSLLVARFPQ